MEIYMTGSSTLTIDSNGINYLSHYFSLIPTLNMITALEQDISSGKVSLRLMYKVIKSHNDTIALCSYYSEAFKPSGNAITSAAYIKVRVLAVLVKAEFQRGGGLKEEQNTRYQAQNVADNAKSWSFV